MRRLSFIFLALVCNVTLQAANYTSSNGYVNTSDVVSSEYSKAELWANLKTWVSLTFKNYEHTVDMEDPEAGIMIIKWSTVQPITFNNFDGKPITNLLDKIQGILKVDVKDNKYRWTSLDCGYTISNNPGAISWGVLGYSSFMGKFVDLGDVSAKIVADLQGDMENTPKYKDEKAEAKNKVNGDYKKAYNSYTLMNTATNVALQQNENLIQSMVKAMETKDDF